MVSPVGFLPVEGWKTSQVSFRKIGFFVFQATTAGASFSGMVQAGSGGQYQPNPKDRSPGAENSENPTVFYVQLSLPEADDFDVEKVCEAIDPDKVWKTPGQAKFFGMNLC